VTGLKKKQISQKLNVKYLKIWKILKIVLTNFPKSWKFQERYWQVYQKKENLEKYTVKYFKQLKIFKSLLASFANNLKLRKMYWQDFYKIKKYLENNPSKDPAHLLWKSGFGHIYSGEKYVVQVKKCSNFVHGLNKIVWLVQALRPRLWSSIFAILLYAELGAGDNAGERGRRATPKTGPW